MSGIIIVKGRKIDQNKLRAFIDSIDIEDYVTDEGYFRSPITGEVFESKQQLWGHIGAYLRTPNRKNPNEPSRAGYVRALRAGQEPTEAQKKAHREYARKRRAAAKAEPVEEPTPKVPELVN